MYLTADPLIKESKSCVCLSSVALTHHSHMTTHAFYMIQHQTNVGEATVHLNNINNSITNINNSIEWIDQSIKAPIEYIILLTFNAWVLDLDPLFFVNIITGDIVTKYIYSIIYNLFFWGFEILQKKNFIVILSVK